MNNKALLAAGCLGLLLVACAEATASSPSNEPAVTAADDEAVTRQASDETKKELGVVRWEEKVTDSRATVRGFSDKGEMILEVERTISGEGNRHVYRYNLKGRKGSTTTMALSLEAADDGKGTLTLLESSLPSNAKRIFELLQQDFAASGAGTSLTAKSIQPLDTSLTKEHCADLVKCGHTKLIRIDADAKAALTCIGAPLVVGGGVAVDLLQGRDPAPGAAHRAGDCARAQENSRTKAAESAEACRIDCIQL